MQSYFNTTFCANKGCYNFNKLLAFIPFKPYLKRAETMPDTSENHIWHERKAYLTNSQTISGTQSRSSPADRPGLHVSRRGSAAIGIFQPIRYLFVVFFHYLFIVFSLPIYHLFAIICYNLSPVFRKIFIKKICTFRPFFLPLHPQTYLRHADKPDL